MRGTHARKGMTMRIVSWILALAMSALAVSPAVAQEWWDSEWHGRRGMTIDTTGTGVNVSGPAGTVPVLLRLTSANFGFTEVLDNGADLRVTDDKGSPLSYQVEKFDKANELALIWVNVPNVNGGEKKTIYVYYGNETAGDGARPAEAFGAEFAAVYHFLDNAGQPVSDATANNNRSQNPPAGVNDGSVIGRGARFAGTTPITIPDSPSLAIPDGGGFTFSGWIKPDQIAGGQIYARGPFAIQLANGIVQVSSSGTGAQASRALTQGQWSHVAVTADGTTLRIFINGEESGSAAMALPAFTGNAVLGQGFTGEMDEVRLGNTAQSAAALRIAAINQGASDKLIAFGEPEEEGGHTNPLVTIVQNTPFDAWVVIAILGVMLVIAIWVMYAKGTQFGEANKANRVFMKHYRRMDDLVPFEQLPDVPPAERKLIAKAPLKAIYDVGMEELSHRHTLRGRGKPLSAETIEAMRASVDAEQVHQNEKLDKWMVLLTIAISGGPFIGLLGTVLGVMLVFGEVAAQGEVNINAIAPGIAASLLATVAGLAVAIPALFAYNYLNSLVVTISNEMRVFVDRLITRLAETSHHAPPPAQAMAAE